jgi:hypothetical protein
MSLSSMVVILVPITIYSDRILILLRAQRAIVWLRVKGPDKQIQIGVMQMLSVKILIAVYFSHLTFFSYKNLTLCIESLILLEYHKKVELCAYIKESNGYKEIVIDFTVHDSDPGRPGRPGRLVSKKREVNICASFSSGLTFVALSRSRH